MLWRTPGFKNVDASLFKNFGITERVKLQFRAEFFNLLNTPQFNVPNRALNTGGGFLPQRAANGSFAVYARSDQILAGLERAVDPNGDGDTSDHVAVALIGVNAPYAGFTHTPEAQAVGVLPVVRGQWARSEIHAAFPQILAGAPHAVAGTASASASARLRTRHALMDLRYRWMSYSTEYP